MLNILLTNEAIIDFTCSASSETMHENNTHKYFDPQKLLAIRCMHVHTQWKTNYYNYTSHVDSK